MLYEIILLCVEFFLQVGKHGIIIEFIDPDYNTRRSATYLPDIAANEGQLSCSLFEMFHCLFIM